MSHHSTDILWQRGDQDFLGNRYSRRHAIRFDGGAEWLGSSSPHVVPVQCQRGTRCSQRLGRHPGHKAWVVPRTTRRRPGTGSLRGGVAPSAASSWCAAARPIS